VSSTALDGPTTRSGLSWLYPCEAVRQVLEPVFEPTFHPSSHGFRPGRSCHTAIEEAKQHLEDWHGWGVDIDLDKFFDRVCHQRLMSRLAQRVSDRRLLVLSDGC
jgi:RNA-directed DNA polymerase